MVTAWHSSDEKTQTKARAARDHRCRLTMFEQDCTIIWGDAPPKEASSVIGPRGECRRSGAIKKTDVTVQKDLAQPRPYRTQSAAQRTAR